jgi:addiction module HigA family antidote
MAARIVGSVDSLAPVHPGEILLEEFIRPFGLSPGKTATRLHIARPRIEKLVRGQTPVTVDTALRLEKLFGATAQFWLNLQTRYDLEMAKRALPDDIETIEAINAAA